MTGLWGCRNYGSEEFKGAAQGDHSLQAGITVMASHSYMEDYLIQRLVTISIKVLSRANIFQEEGSRPIFPHHLRELSFSLQWTPFNTNSWGPSKLVLINRSLY